MNKAITTGFSLRDSLINHQGVTLEEDVKKHINLVYNIIQHVPSIRANRYRVGSVCKDIVDLY